MLWGGEGRGEGGEGREEGRGGREGGREGREEREGGREGGRGGREGWTLECAGYMLLAFVTAGVNILANDKIKKNAFIIR